MLSHTFYLLDTTCIHGHGVHSSTVPIGVSARRRGRRRGDAATKPCRAGMLGFFAYFDRTSRQVARNPLHLPYALIADIVGHPVGRVRGRRGAFEKGVVWGQASVICRENSLN